MAAPKAHHTSISSQPAPQRWLPGLVAIGFLGTGAELVLLDHFEGFWQQVPFWLVGLGLLTLVLHGFVRCAVCRRLFQGAMVLAAVGGTVGLYLHFQGNMEFELEMRPDETGWPLVWRTLKGATPALSPGMMILLGLLGLTAAHQRTTSDRAVQSPQSTTEH